MGQPTNGKIESQQEQQGCPVGENRIRTTPWRLKSEDVRISPSPKGDVQRKRVYGLFNDNVCHWFVEPAELGKVLDWRFASRNELVLQLWVRAFVNS